MATGIWRLCTSEIIWKKLANFVVHTSDVQFHCCKTTSSDEDVPAAIKTMNYGHYLSSVPTAAAIGRLEIELRKIEDRALNRNRANRISQLLIGDGYLQLGQSEETAHSILNI